MDYNQFAQEIIICYVFDHDSSNSGFEIRAVVMLVANS